MCPHRQCLDIVPMQSLCLLLACARFQILFRDSLSYSIEPIRAALLLALICTQSMNTDSRSATSVCNRIVRACLALTPEARVPLCWAQAAA